MALSGTLETFSLPEVLRLLAGTAKTGVLVLRGDRGSGRVFVADGALVAADADRAVHADIDGTLFELLRFVDATFEFQSAVEPDERVEARTVEDALETAGARLEEWRSIEAVVPSLDVWVRMVPEVDEPRTVAPAQWRILASVGTGLSGHALAGDLAQDEFAVCGQLRDLVEAGMVEIDELPAERPQPAWIESGPVAPAVDAEPTFVEPALSTHEVSSLGANLASFVAAGTVEEPVAVDPLAVHAPEPDEPSATFDTMVDTGVDEPADVDEAPAFEPLAADAEPSPTDELDQVDEVDQMEEVGEVGQVDGAAVDVEDADDLAGLAHLSPKAAAAIEAIAGPGDEEADDVPTEVGEAEVEPAPAANGRDDIDQNLLLRFLSSAER